tara:strand:+ start:922 stop:2265 length:1344 start_codon:yes stop_codon:yes gene_type:complete
MAITVVKRYFINVLNLSQLTTVKTGTKINPEKAREVLDTNIFELLPTQTTRQDQINDFFNEFNDLVGQAPAIQDVDGDGAGEYIQPQADLLDRQGRVSIENKSTAYITRLNTHANTNNQGKTLESMRNKLNTYLGDVDNVVQVIEDQRPEYENKSSGFLKIRKPNQAIILRNPNQVLEFQKTVTTNIGTGPSFLMEGFTITMWVRFVGKTGKGTLFNFGNPLASVSPYGFRLETETVYADDQYRRFLKLGVWDHRHNTFHDNHTGYTLGPGSSRGREDGSHRDGYGNSPHNGLSYWGGSSNPTRYHAYPNIPTDDLNEWFFICASFNPNIDEDVSLLRFDLGSTGQGAYIWDEYRYTPAFWQNHILPPQNVTVESDLDDYTAPDGTVNDTDNDMYVANSGLGAKCKVEVISRSDLLRARGYKGGNGVDSLEVNVEEEIPEQEDTFTG